MSTESQCSVYLEKNRFKVCGPCGMKIVCGSKRIEFFRLNSTHENLIRKHMKCSYNILDPKFPASICTTCRHTLFEYENNVFRRPMAVIKSYENIYLKRYLRTTQHLRATDKCSCYTCITAASKNQPKTKKGRGYGRKFTEALECSNNIPSASRTHDVVEKICKKCRAQIKRGKSHVCSSKPTAARRNIYF